MYCELYPETLYGIIHRALIPKFADGYVVVGLAMIGAQWTIRLERDYDWKPGKVEVKP